MSGRWIIHPLEGKFAVMDLSTNKLVRGWRKGTSNLIWRGTLDEAKAMCELLSKQGPGREEMDKTQKIHYLNVQRRKRNQVVTKSSFAKCGKCSRMVKSDHEC